MDDGPHPLAVATANEAAGAAEPYEDPVLYDWEYRRRRDDVAFYRMLAGERGGPVLDLGCGTGRLLVPLLEDGHRVVGLDRSRAMLARAAARLRRLPARKAQAALLIRADLRAFAFRGRRFPLAVAAFHGIQHLVDDEDLLRCFRNVRRALTPRGWFAFDVFSPQPRWLSRPADRWFDRTQFRHPATGRLTEYSVSHRLDEQRRALHMRIGYRPLRPGGQPAGPRRVIRLCHRQLSPEEVKALLRRADLTLASSWGGFAGEPPPGTVGRDTEQHVYLARPRRH